MVLIDDAVEMKFIFVNSLLQWSFSLPAWRRTGKILYATGPVKSRRVGT